MARCLSMTRDLFFSGREIASKKHALIRFFTEPSAKRSKQLGRISQSANLQTSSSRRKKWRNRPNRPATLAFRGTFPYLPIHFSSPGFGLSNFASYLLGDCKALLPPTFPSHKEAVERAGLESTRRAREESFPLSLPDVTLMPKSRPPKKRERKETPTG